MTESNAPYVRLYELIERSAKGRREGELRVMAWRGILKHACHETLER